MAKKKQNTQLKSIYDFVGVTDLQNLDVGTVYESAVHKILKKVIFDDLWLLLPYKDINNELRNSTINNENFEDLDSSKWEQEYISVGLNPILEKFNIRPLNRKEQALLLKAIARIYVREEMFHISPKVDMSVVSRESMQTYIHLRYTYDLLKSRNQTNRFLWKEIENFIVNVINKDEEYFSKLSSYDISSSDLRYCL